MLLSAVVDIDFAEAFNTISVVLIVMYVLCYDYYGY